MNRLSNTLTQLVLPGILGCMLLVTWQSASAAPLVLGYTGQSVEVNGVDQLAKFAQFAAVAETAHDVHVALVYVPRFARGPAVESGWRDSLLQEVGVDAVFYLIDREGGASKMGVFTNSRFGSATAKLIIEAFEAEAELQLAAAQANAPWKALLLAAVGAVGPLASAAGPAAVNYQPDAVAFGGGEVVAFDANTRRMLEGALQTIGDGLDEWRGEFRHKYLKVGVAPGSDVETRYKAVVTEITNRFAVFERDYMLGSVNAKLVRVNAQGGVSLTPRQVGLMESAQGGYAELRRLVYTGLAAKQATTALAEMILFSPEGELIKQAVKGLYPTLGELSPEFDYRLNLDKKAWAGVSMPVVELISGKSVSTTHTLVVQNTVVPSVQYRGRLACTEIDLGGGVTLDLSPLDAGVVMNAAPSQAGINACGYKGKFIAPKDLDGRVVSITTLNLNAPSANAVAAQIGVGVLNDMSMRQVAAPFQRMDFDCSGVSITVGANTAVGGSLGDVSVSGGACYFVAHDLQPGNDAVPLAEMSDIPEEEPRLATMYYLYGDDPTVSGDVVDPQFVARAEAIRAALSTDGVTHKIKIELRPYFTGTLTSGARAAISPSEQRAERRLSVLVRQLNAVLTDFESAPYRSGYDVHSYNVEYRNAAEYKRLTNQLVASGFPATSSVGAFLEVRVKLDQ